MEHEHSMCVIIILFIFIFWEGSLNSADRAFNAIWTTHIVLGSNLLCLTVNVEYERQPNNRRLNVDVHGSHSAERKVNLLNRVQERQRRWGLLPLMPTPNWTTKPLKDPSRHMCWMCTRFRFWVRDLAIFQRLYISNIEYRAVSMGMRWYDLGFDLRRWGSTCHEVWKSASALSSNRRCDNSVFLKSLGQSENFGDPNATHLSDW